MVITLEPASVGYWHKPPESGYSYDLGAGSWSLVLRFRETAVAQVPASPSG